MQTDDELKKHDAFMPNIWSGEAKHYKDLLLRVWAGLSLSLYSAFTVPILRNVFSPSEGTEVQI